MFPQVLDHAIVRFREGLATGVVETRLTTTIMIAQIDNLLAQPVDQSPFTSPVREFPAAVPATARAKLRSDFAAVASDQLYPAYRRLRAFLHDEYLPAAREQVGLSAMKGGAGLYRRLIERETTLKLDPAAVHALGLSEVARIQHDMDGVRQELQYPGTLAEFFVAIRTDPRFHPHTADELAASFIRVGKAVDAQIPRYFSHVPKAQLLIRPYPCLSRKVRGRGQLSAGLARCHAARRVQLQHL